MCNCPATFHIVVLEISSNITQDCVQIYMDKFSIYNDSFLEAFQNLLKVLIRCQESNLSLSNIKFCVMQIAGIILGHLIYDVGIQVVPSTIEIIR